MAPLVVPTVYYTLYCKHIALLSLLIVHGPGYLANLSSDNKDMYLAL